MDYDAKSYEEWVKIYELKTNQKVESDDGFHLFFLPDKGFCRLDTNAESKTLIIKEMCGDGIYWNNYARKLAQEMDLDKIATFLHRPVDIVARHFGGTLESETDGIKVYKDKEGHKVEVIPYHDINIIVQYMR